jgi:hypothetical protein
LYKFDLARISEALTKAASEGLLGNEDGTQVWLVPDFPGAKGAVLLKVILVIEHERINVITVYPLKKRSI